MTLATWRRHTDYTTDKSNVSSTILYGDGILPVKGYSSVNLPSGLYAKVKMLIKTRPDLGYRSVTEFVAEAVRQRTEEIEKLAKLQSLDH